MGWLKGLTGKVDGQSGEGPFLCWIPFPVNLPPGALYAILPGEGQQSFFGPSSKHP